MVKPGIQQLTRVLSFLCMAGLAVCAVHANDRNFVADKTTNQQDQVQQAAAQITYDDLDQQQTTDAVFVPVKVSDSVAPPPPAPPRPPVPAGPHKLGPLNISVNWRFRTEAWDFFQPAAARTRMSSNIPFYGLASAKK